MNIFKLIFKNLVYYRLTNINLLLGTILCSGIIAGALIIGDSVKYSLQKIVNTRLGKTDFVITSNNSFFTLNLANNISNILKTNTASIMQLKGICSTDSIICRNIKVNGVDNKFWYLADDNNIEISEIQEGEIYINSQLSDFLNLKTGNDLVLKIEKPGFVPFDAPFVSDENNIISIRTKIKKIITNNEFGNFNLQNNQITPFNIFISIDYLNKLMKMNNRSNIILIEGKNDISESKIVDIIKTSCSFEDLNLNLKSINNLKLIELTTKKIFIDTNFQNFIIKKYQNSFPVYTYFVNSIKNLNNSIYETPYSFVSTTNKNLINNLGANEIVINKWLATDLNLKINDSIEIKYFTIGLFRKLKEEKAKFKVKNIIPIEGYAADKFLMPDFEGLSDVDKCSDWNTGIPIDLKKIRKKDEDYWKIYKGTPKAFISYNSAKKLWENRFGTTTAIRFSMNENIDSIKNYIIKNSNPKSFDINVISAKKDGIYSAVNGVDFGGLFLGLSFFVLLASIIMLVLLYSLNIDLRAKEQGILLALGFKTAAIKRIYLSEALFISLIGSLVGVFVGIMLDKYILVLLNSIWFDIVRTSEIEICINYITVITSFLIAFLISIITLYFVNNYKLKQVVINIVKNNVYKPAKRIKKQLLISFIILILSILSVIIVFIFVNGDNKFQNSSIFFIIGSVSLIGFLSLINISFRLINNKNILSRSILGLSVRNIIYKRKRNIGLISILSIGIFIIISVSLNRIDFNLDSASRKSGTGGFLIYTETTLPVLYDLNTKQGKERYNLNDVPDDVKFIQISCLHGDDASCLNLNKIKMPELVGVPTDEFLKRNAFSFESIDKSINNANPWEVLGKPISGDIIPAIADQSVIKWNLGLSVGDTIIYTNEKGKLMKLKLIAGLSNSIFQGKIIVCNKVITDNFPSLSGCNIILTDAKKEQFSEINKSLISGLNILGINTTSTAKRLEMFNSVTNTYLNIFLVLGGLALIISVFSIAILIFRNMIEQKCNHALMQAVGLKNKTILYIIFIENIFVVFIGIIIGIITGLISVFPSISIIGSGVPFQIVFNIISIFVLSSSICILISIKLGLKNNFIKDLNYE